MAIVYATLTAKSMINVFLLGGLTLKCIMIMPKIFVTRYAPPKRYGKPAFGNKRETSNAIKYARGILTKASFHQEAGLRI